MVAALTFVLLTQSDGNGRLQQVSDPTAWAQYTYDNRSRVTQTLYSNGVKSVYGYDSSGRTTALTHRNASNAIIIGYTASYDSAGRLGGVTENNGSVTSYGYDFAGRLLTENRTGTNPYVSTYSYTNRGQRATAFRSENGVASHNGTYTYDDAGRLTNVTDTVTTSGLGGSYTWNNDSTLASYPGPGYTRKLSYDEEGRLTKIDRDNGTTITPVFEYGYGFDGNRRWRKDMVGNIQDWYPCGVACCAGELVTMRSTNGGASWTAISSNLYAGVSFSQGNANLRDFEGRYFSSTGQYDTFGNWRGSAAGPTVNGEILPSEKLLGEGLIGAEAPTLVALGIGIQKPQLQKRDDGVKRLCEELCDTLICHGFKGDKSKKCKEVCKKYGCDFSKIEKLVGPIADGTIKKFCLATSGKDAATCVACCNNQCDKTYPIPPGQGTNSLNSTCKNQCLSGRGGLGGCFSL